MLRCDLSAAARPRRGKQAEAKNRCRGCQMRTHVGEARRVLALKEAVGRRMDFLMQEFLREANTLGSKSVDARTTRAAVELKVLIEQLREQVQNIE